MYSGPITDTHQHLWDYNYKYSHGWLQMDSHPWTGDWTMLAKNYLINDFSGKYGYHDEFVELNFQDNSHSFDSSLIYLLRLLDVFQK